MQMCQPIDSENLVIIVLTVPSLTDKWCFPTSQNTGKFHGVITDDCIFVLSFITFLFFGFKWTIMTEINKVHLSSGCKLQYNN